MAIGKYAGAVVLSYVVFAIIYIIGAMFYGDAMATNAEFLRAQDHPMYVYAYIGHLGQTLALVYIFMKWVNTSDVKEGALFGLGFGVFMASTDAVTFSGFNVNTAPMVPLMINSLIAYPVVGALLAVVFGPRENANGAVGA